MHPNFTPLLADSFKETQFKRIICFIFPTGICKGVGAFKSLRFLLCFAHDRSTMRTCQKDSLSSVLVNSMAHCTRVFIPFHCIYAAFKHPHDCDTILYLKHFVSYEETFRLILCATLHFSGNKNDLLEI